MIQAEENIEFYINLQIQSIGILHNIVELLTSFPKSLRSSKSEFGPKSYDPNMKVYLPSQKWSGPFISLRTDHPVYRANFVTIGQRLVLVFGPIYTPSVGSFELAG